MTTLSELISEVESSRVSLLAATSPGSIYRKWVDLLPDLKEIEHAFGSFPVIAADGKPARVDVVDPSAGILVDIEPIGALRFLRKKSGGNLTLKSLAAMIQSGCEDCDYGVAGI